MSYLINILQYSIGSLFIGVLITLIGVCLMFYIVKSWRRGAEFSPGSFIVGAILFFFLSFQSVLLCGAITIKSYSDDVEAYINTLVAKAPEDMVLDQRNSQYILDSFAKEWPLVAYYVDYADFRGHTPDNIATAMVDELRSVMNWYIFRRLAWSLAFIVIGAVLVIKTMRSSLPKNNYKSNTTTSRLGTRDYDD